MMGMLYGDANKAGHEDAIWGYNQALDSLCFSLSFFILTLIVMLDTTGISTRVQYVYYSIVMNITEVEVNSV
ncbi:hypothetical protein RYX36_001526 [Vicia faba]